MSEVNGTMGKIRLFFSALIVCIAIGGIVYASGEINQRVAGVESKAGNNADAIRQLDEKKADKRELDDIKRQLDRIEQKLDRR